MSIVRMTAAAARPPGVQSVDRAGRLLQVLALNGRQGLALGPLADRAGLDAATARRLLLSLMRIGFVSQDERDRRYFIGLELFSLAAAAANRFDLGEMRRSALASLSRQSSFAAAFFLRDADDVICIDAVHGAHSPAASDIGARRPIGAEPFGLAVLAALPDEEGETVMIRNVRRYARDPEEAIRQVGERLRRTRRMGYSVEADPARGRSALAVAVKNRDGRPEGAIGVTVSAAGAAALEAVLPPLQE